MGCSGIRFVSFAATHQTAHHVPTTSHYSSKWLGEVQISIRTLQRCRWSGVEVPLADQVRAKVSVNRGLGLLYRQIGPGPR